MIRYFIVLMVFVVVGCDGTPLKHKNQIHVSETELSGIKDSLLSAIKLYDETHNDFVKYYRDKKLRIEFIDLFFNETKDKVVFTIIDSVTVREGTQVESENGLIYSTFGFSGKKNEDNSWELNQLRGDGLSLYYSVTHSYALKHAKNKFRTRMDTYAFPSGRIPYKYNIDDIRIFDGPLFQDSVSVRSGD